MRGEDYPLSHVKRTFSGAPWEKRVGYCRAIRMGNRISVSGTAPVGDDGKVHAPGDGYAQAIRCFEIIESALKELVGTRRDVIRTRMFVTNVSRWEEYGRAHGEYFGDFPPATTMVEVKRLIDPAMLIEVEAEAEITPDCDRDRLAERIVEWRRDDLLISTDRSRFHIDSIHEFLTHSYWAQGRSKEAVLRTIENSLCFGLYQDKNQIGFARVATDFTVFGYLMDVYVQETYRRKGLGSWLVETVLSHPDLQTVKWILATTDAHHLYNKFGFVPLEEPRRLMERKAIGPKEVKS